MNIGTNIKKILLCFIVIFFSAFFMVGLEAKAIVSATDKYYINDYANVIDSDVENKILEINKKYENTQEKPQVVVTTVDNLEDMDVNQYALKLFEELKIGNKDKDNGVLILLSTTDKSVKIEVGYGLEGALPDSICGRILDNSLDLLKNSEYSRAISNIFDNIVYKIAEEYDYDAELVDTNNLIEEDASLAWWKIVLVIVIGVILIIIDCVFFGGVFTELILSLVLRIIFNSDDDSSFGGGGSSGGGGASRGF